MTPAIRSELTEQFTQYTARMLAFWKKVSSDWVPLLTSILTYRLLLSAFSILLVILAISGLILGALSPSAQAALNARLATSLPLQNGQEVVRAVTSRLAQSAGLLFIIALAAALYSGSRFFVTLEKCFDLIFRVHGRRGLARNLMAMAMLLLYAVLVPLVLIASLVPTTLRHWLQSLPVPVLHSPVVGFGFQVLGLAISALIGMVLCGAIYIVVPNLPLRVREVWKGTLVAAVLLLLANLLFPVYVALFLKPQNRGTVIGLLVVILAYYYFQAFIFLLGAEVNAWDSGIRQPVGSVDVVMEGAQQLSLHGAWHVPSAQAPSAQTPSPESKEAAATGIGELLTDPLAP
jgi:YihY family inner membrane protein